MDETIFLSDMKSGQEGKIFEITGGMGVISKLDALGVRAGKSVKRINSSFTRGPVIFEIEKTQIAIGRGIAQKIFIKIRK